MAHREGVPRTRPPNRDFLGFCMSAASKEPGRPLGSHFCLEGEGGALKPPSPSNFPSPLTGVTLGTSERVDNPLLPLSTAPEGLFRPGLGKSGPDAPSGKGPPQASSNAVGCPEMAHREGVLRTRPPNRDFPGFCVFRGAEGISRAQQKRFVQKRPSLAKQGPL